MYLECAHDPMLQEDLERVVAAELPWDKLAGKTVLITGATGLIGSSVVRALCCANRVRRLSIRMILPVRNPAKARSLFGDLLDREPITLQEADLCQPLTVSGTVDYILHGAAVTNSKLMVTEPVETILAAMEGTRYLLDLAREKAVSGMVYLSSMEMYGAPSAGHEYVREEDLGYVDIMQVRSCYPESKRLAENLCVCYHAEYGVPVKIARLAQTFGAGIAASENRVFAQFARSFINGTDIVLHTTGESRGNYCYTADCVEALLFLLLNGENGEAYNVTNENANCTIREMAELVCRMSGDRIRVVLDIPQDAMTYGYAPAVNRRLCGEKLAKLGWKATTDLPEMYRRLIESMKANGIA